MECTAVYSYLDLQGHQDSGVSCSQETKAYFGDEAVPWGIFIYYFFNIA